LLVGCNENWRGRGHLSSSPLYVFPVRWRKPANRH
jgi:hypothetical protein